MLSEEEDPLGAILKINAGAGGTERAIRLVCRRGGAGTRERPARPAAGAALSP